MATTSTNAGETSHSGQESLGPSEGAILSRVLEPERATLSAAAARAILELSFSQADVERMRQLSAKARDGSLSADEQVEINNYERIGHFLSLMKSKARRSLKGRSNGNGKRRTH